MPTAAANPTVDTGATGQQAGHRLVLGLSGWVIEDGNYPDLSVGDCLRFPLVASLVREHGRNVRRERGIRRLRGCLYVLAGRISWASPERTACLLDGPLPVFLEVRDREPLGAVAWGAGDWVATVAELRLPEPHICSGLCRGPEAAKSTATWRVERIRVRRPRLPGIRRPARRPEAVSCTSVLGSGGVGGFDEFLLSCRRLGPLPGERSTFQGCEVVP